MNAMVEGGANRDFAYYHIDPKATEKYCMESRVAVKEVQNSIARNLFYRMLFFKISGEKNKYENDMEWLTAIHDKELNIFQKENTVFNSLATGINNASEIELGAESSDIIMDMPDPLRMRLIVNKRG